MSFRPTIFFQNPQLFIHPRAPNTIHFHLYISMFHHDLSILPQKNSFHDLIPNPRIILLSINHSNRILTTYNSQIDRKRETMRCLEFTTELSHTWQIEINSIWQTENGLLLLKMPNTVQYLINALQFHGNAAVLHFNRHKS